MNQLLTYTNRAEDKMKKMGIFIAIAIILVLVCFSTVFEITNKNNEKILKNVYIDGVSVGKKTKEEAHEALSQKLIAYNNSKITLSINGEVYTIRPDDVGFEADNLEEALESAYQYGRDQGFLANNYTILLSNFRNKNIDLTYSLNDRMLDELLGKISAANETIVLDDTYLVSGEQIIITRGQDGSKIDEDTLDSYILAAIKNNVSTVEIPVIESESKKIDLNELYAEVYVEPKDAFFVSGDKFEVIVDQTGIDFDLQDAKARYDKLSDSSELIITLREIEPAVTLADLDKELFNDVLATFETKYDSSESNRTKNVVLASEKVNDTIVYPGEEFSFDKAIGSRTTANGYAVAASYANGKVVDSVGGGICQVSSTLYNIALKANLKITERKAHGMPVSYAEPSLDATIAEGSIDFKFKNTRSYPIKIESSATNGILKMSILGIKEENEPTVELESKVLETLKYKIIEENDATMYVGNTKIIQEPVDGYVSEAYKILKNASGDVISRELISKDTYAATDEIIKVGTKVKTVTPPVVKPDTSSENVTVEPQEEVPTKPNRQLPTGWDSPESPYRD
ncbi:MAG: VanW family protein [Clostridia bacterium]|nr:VanW family protein [Clostridia bacterium]